MERTGSQDGPLRQLLAADARVVLLRGPVASGKTSLALEAYRQCVSANHLPTARLLVPNDVTARDMSRRLLATSANGVLLSPGVMTFDSLSSRILSAAGGATRRIGCLRRRMLLRKIVHDLHAAGELPALAPAADTPGLIAALQRNVSELKRATADPEELAQRVGSPNGSAGDVLKVYRAYQQVLNDTNACDVEGQLWLARDFLKQNDTSLTNLGLGNLQTLIVDGFTDFTPTQLEILALLRDRLTKLIVTLPLADEGDSRERLWLWTNRTYTRLRNALGDGVREVSLSGQYAHGFVGMKDSEDTTCPRRRGHATQSEPSLSALAQNVFRYDTPTNCPEGLNIIAAPGMEAEVQDVARRIKKLLLAGNAGRIAVLSRDIEPYHPVLQRVFEQMNIPIRPAESPLPEVPAVQFCFSVVDLARPAGQAGLQKPFAFPNILRVLRNSYLSPAALGDFDATTIHHAEMIIRRGNVLAGRDACAQAVEQLVQQCQRQESADEDAISSSPLPADETLLKKAGALLEALFDLSERSQTPAGFLAMLDHLRLAETIAQQDSAAGVARDFRALEAVRHAFAGLSDILDMNSPADLDALREGLADISLPSQRGEHLVDVLGVLDARAIRWDHVFLLGCDEGLFPQRFSDSSLLGEADRKRWRSAGVQLDLRADLTAREMLLFYFALSRAEHSLTISYRKSDSLGRPGAPGGFLQNLIDSLGGFDSLKSANAFSSPPVGRFVPLADDIATKNEALAAAMMGQFSRDVPNAASAIAWATTHDATRLARATLGAQTMQQRWSPGACSHFDGRLSDPALLERLRNTVPVQTVFSAAQLSTYNQCPWRYFAQFLLHLRPLEAPQRELQAVYRGTFCHDVLCATLSNLANTNGRPVAITQLCTETLLEAFEQAFAAQARQVELRQPAYPALWDIQREQMHAQLREYLLSQQADNMFHPQCLHFELSFGQGKKLARWMDPASCPNPVEVQTPAGVIRLQGRIDRVDRVTTAAGEGLFVVDYKTGSLPRESDTIEGRNTQMPLYSAVVEKLLGESALGGAFHSIKGDKPSTFAAVKVSRGAIKQDDAYEENRRQALAAISWAVEGIAAGHFDLLPSNNACDYCEFRQLCHFSPARDELRRSTLGGAKS